MTIGHELNSREIECWGLLELRLQGPSEGNPFKEVELGAEFVYKHRVARADGFYNGQGQYIIRFMPDAEGEWVYKLRSSRKEWDGAEGSFTCTTPKEGNHGPVRVRSAVHFAYEDGTPYRPFGTTCYVWTHQADTIQEETLESLRQGPFNKIRMCVFPKRYSFNMNEPDCFPFAGSRDEGFDWTRFNPVYFERLEKRIVQLQQLGIEADLILFHPYDQGHWGFDRMDAETDARYLRYVIARLGAYRNVWWSLANEFDFMQTKTMDDWDRFFRIVQENDPYQHLRSIHNGTKMYDPANLVLYDHNKPWVTHVSMQYWELTPTTAWLKRYGKPVVVDECCYEGNLPQRWGNISGMEMTARFWDGFTRGGSVGHGETFLNPEEVIWWSKGGKLQGESPQRIAFLRAILEEAPWDAVPIERMRDAPAIGVEGEYYLQYFGLHCPAYRELALPEDRSFRIDLIDTWNMTVASLEGTYSGAVRIDLPGAPYFAIRATAAAAEQAGMSS
ncbi:DUF5605 domain-containing protein [Paenibacillus sp. TAB 01]|uniref:DUF5605 domain-containing protein n=1 Tax=Paenibacillus sp. TAB 01 TaxID=3368988 RepID=UPI003752BF09